MPVYVCVSSTPGSLSYLDSCQKRLEIYHGRAYGVCARGERLKVNLIFEEEEVMIGMVNNNSVR